MKYIYIFITLILCSAQIAWAQNRTLKGQVTDEKGGIIVGATISLKGTNRGVNTDSEGKFSIAVPSGVATLVVQFVGYVKKEVNIAADGTTAKITLQDDVNVLQEVTIVNVGYGTVSREALTGSVSSLRADQIKDIPINSAEQALAGRLAGVQVTATDGAPGTNVQIRIRGGSSITQDNSPLYIVDGVQVENALRALSPQDIESIDVLKDAASTAIYGARGANGVVLITTKTGKRGKMTASYNGFVGASKILGKLDVLDATDYLKYQYERSRGNVLDSTSFVNNYGPFDTLEVYRDKGRDWQNEVFGKVALQQTHNLSLNGGDEKINYNLSLTTNGQEGVMINSDFDRKLLGFKMELRPNQKFRAGFNVRYTDERINGAGVSSPGLARDNFLKNTLSYRPIDSKNPTDIDFYDAQYLAVSDLRNPVINATAVYRKTFGKRYNLSGYLSYALTPEITARVTVGYDNNNSRTNNFYSEITGQASLYSAMPIASILTGVVNSLNNSNTVTYSKKNIAKHHDIDVLIGQESYQTRNEQFNAETRYFPLGISPEKALSNMNLGNPPAGQAQPRPTTNNVMARTFSFFGRVNYGLDKKYLLTLTARADGSSKFMDGQRWGFFPSGALAWRISDEKFAQAIKPVVSDAKLRLSYGSTGNNRINDFSYLPLYSSNTYYGLNEQLVPGVVPTQLANPNVKWETTVSRNLGLDLSFFKNRVQFTTDIYYNSTKDLLLQNPIPQTSGYTQQTQNIAATSNRGIEFQLSGLIVQTKDFSYSASYNMSFNSNRVEKLNDGITSKGYASGWDSNTGNDYLVEVGKPLGQMYGYRSDGYYKVSDFNFNATTGVYTLKPDVASFFGVTRSTIQPGTMKLLDLGGSIKNPDGSPAIHTDEDRTVIGNAAPKFIGGLNQQFSYKNWDMSIFVNFSVGNDIYNANKIELTNSRLRGVNLLESVNGRFTTIDQNGKSIYNNPAKLEEYNANATTWRPYENSNLFTDWAVEDGSFLRINNITLGYTLPTDLAKKIKLSSLRFYATVNNLATITGYSGFDPEVNTRTNGGLTPGVDYSAYPRSRTILLGINLTF
ncbi:SusC/RagA family TonB-linked outer membrane protein [Pedobacter sp. Leaf41]|uniref:SusC/RagA family TonB-linked outer membrane protein n=1 Tax=Pedobacter sp. Leaf41 TaxID=1736218 RepID=UPI000703926F|nr:TonB-dependent receptor [Pedobacter sp. Leaf41]KQN36289.1 SusC/RagA family TonB-linked outer membrane protein [Pedobacter sp. Leaf41]